jgi:pimeloyl-ACP methyl ester carboxylesterase
MATIKINGYDFEYIEKGNGRPVIFVHGGISDYRIWKDQIDFFSEKYRVIAYSRRYHYPNKWNGDGSDYSIYLHAQDLAAFVKALNLEKVCLVGNSYGAFTSLITAIKNPDLVKALVLNEPPVLPLLVSNPDNPLQIFSLFMKNFSTAKSFMRFGLNHMKPAMKALRDDQFEKGVRLFADGALGEGRYDTIPEDAKSTFMDNSAALKAELLGPGFPPFPVDEARRLSIPTLFVYGQKSPKFLWSISDLLLKILPKSEKAVIPNASHLTHGENPVEYNKTVLEFLSKQN